MASIAKARYYKNIPNDDTYYDDKNSDTLLSVEAIGWTYPNHAFKEWNRAADGTGVSANPGDSINTGGSDGFTLKTWYAIWEEPTPAVTITYKNATIATMDATGVKTLLTGDAFCEDDIIVSYTAPAPCLQTKSVTPTESAQTVTPDSGYDGLSEVDVGAISSSYVGTGITRRSSSDLTASGATVTAPAGYYASDASASVASGTEGTPTATKGTVSNHTITVTPSVTNTEGYIAGGTQTGTAVSVAASELVSGSYTITSSGTKDVTNYASAYVAAGSAKTPATTITATPSISVNASGLITASVSTSKSVTPTVTKGYVSSGTSGTVTVSGSNTSQLSTQAAQTITPTTADQTIASGKYLTGVQTIKGDANLLAENIKKDVVLFSITGTYEGVSYPSATGVSF